MAQFVSGVDTVHKKEVFSAVSYLMLIMLSRSSQSTFVSFKNPFQLYVLFKCMPSPVFFSRTNNVSVAISPSGSTTAGESYSLTCFATLHIGNPPLPDPNIPSPTFEWFFGPSGNDPLPSGLIPTATILNSNTYTSTLQFSPLSQTHTGNYTCQLGAGSLVNSSNLAITCKYNKACSHKFALCPLIVSSLIL